MPSDKAQNEYDGRHPLSPNYLNIQETHTEVDTSHTTYGNKQQTLKFRHQVLLSYVLYQNMPMTVTKDFSEMIYED